MSATIRSTSALLAEMQAVRLRMALASARVAPLTPRARRRARWCP